MLAHLEVASQERPQNWDEIAIVVLEALRQSAPLPIQRLQFHKQRILLALEPPIEHDPVHVVVHHQLQAPSQHDPARRRLRHLLHVIHHGGGLRLPPLAVLLHHLVGEERHRHDPSHLAPVLAVDGEHHVLSLPGENVEHHVTRARPELHPLRVEDLLRVVRRRHDDEVTLPHAEEEDIAEFLRVVGEVAVVEVVADLEPVPEDRDRNRPRRQLELPATELRHHGGDDDGEEDAEERLLE